jgi:hypothetical protein
MEDARKGITEPRRLKRLEHWKAIVERDKSAWEPERLKMEWREELFNGTKKRKALVTSEENKKDLKCLHVRNVIAENIESMVDSRVPRPKVTAMNQNDEELARTLEELLRSCANRLHLRVLNDQAERMGPVQGGFFWMIEWDDSIKSPDGPGDVKISILHPKQVIPQAGIYTDVEDMDHITVMVPMTVLQVLERYGVDVDRVAETDADAKGSDADAESEAGLVTVYQLFYRNGRGGIGNLAWTGDVLLCDREDYQARHVMRCKSCGAVATFARRVDPERRKELRTAGQLDDRTKRCEYCEGTEFEETELTGRVVMPGEGAVLMDSQGNEFELKEAVPWLDRDERLHIEERTVVPYYQPNLFPIKIQKNISKFGKLLGTSDVDKMEDAQNLIKGMDKKVIDRVVKAGTVIALPNDVRTETSTEDGRVYRVTDPAKMSMFKTFDFSGDISNELQIEGRAYEEARQSSGVTDSMQGRRDPTATSAKAKEYSASKAEGRMESRRVMKQEAWAKIYEIIAKLFLAYADKGRRLRVELPEGGVRYDVFQQKDFLKKDDKGRLYYEDGFIFSVDDATSIGESREAMWQEINRSFAAGTLGDPKDIGTLILYWGLMEQQSYPGAGSIKKMMEERRDRMAQEQAAQNQTPQTPTAPGEAIQQPVV